MTTPDPYSEYHRLRAEDPVHHEPATASWVLTRYADMEGVLRAPGWSCDHRNASDHQRWLTDMGAPDVIADVGYPFPVTVICELLGVPVEDRDLFRTHTRQLAIILEWQLTNEQFMGAAEASFAFATYLFPLFEERRRDPRDDLISALV